MLIYLIMFALTIACTCFAEKNFKKNDKKHKIYGIIFSTFAIIIPTLFAALRSITVGADTSGYVLNDFNKALTNKNFEYLMRGTNEEFGFIAIVYLTSFTKNIHVLLFVIEFIMMICIYKFAYDRKDKTPMTLVIVIYLLMCYGESICVMRQHIAFAILLYSLRYADKKQYLKMFICYILAISFHLTSIVFGVTYAIYIICNSEKIQLKNKAKILIALILGIVIIILIFKPLMYVFTYNIKILPERYYIYFNNERFTNSSVTSFITARSIFKMFWLAIYSISLYFNRKNDNAKNDLMSIALIVIDIIIYMISLQFTVLSRLSYFFFYPSILLNLNVLKEKCDSKKIFKNIIYGGIIAIFIFYFWYTIIFNSQKEGGYKTYPYKSDIIMQTFNE